MSGLAQAYAELEAAIRQVAALEEHEGLVTDWVVLAAVQQVTGDGVDLTTMARLMPDGRIPYYRLLGLVAFAQSEIRDEILRGDDG